MAALSHPQLEGGGVLPDASSMHMASVVHEPRLAAERVKQFDIPSTAD
jgi:hypothetical protein